LSVTPLQSLGKTVLSTYGYDHEYWWRFAPIGFLIFFIVIMNGVTAVALRILSGANVYGSGSPLRVDLREYRRYQSVNPSITQGVAFHALHDLSYP